MTGAEFRELRQAGGLQQGRLAQIAGIPRATLCNYERSQVAIPPRILGKLLHALYAYRETREAEFSQAEQELVKQ